MTEAGNVISLTDDIETFFTNILLLLIINHEASVIYIYY